MRYLSAGESHGQCLTGIIEGLPAGLPLSAGSINKQLQRRQKGYGRGKRMDIESDQVEICSGVRHGHTMGSPVTLVIRNRDWENWKNIMSSAGQAAEQRAVTAPRPGHADLAGGIKYRRSDLRDILERASARETAMRVAVGSVGRIFLEYFKIDVTAHVLSIGEIRGKAGGFTFDQIRERGENSPLRCVDPEAEKLMMREIDTQKENGDSLGGVFEVIVRGIPPGLGSHVHWDRRLDGRVAGALMSLQGIKGVEVGEGFATARAKGSQVHDPLFYKEDKGIYRSTNRAGGLEGGITNGEELVFRAAMKPIPTLYRSLPSVDLQTKKEVRAAVERSDICAVPAAAVVGEAIVAWELAAAFQEKFAGDSLAEVQESYERYQQHVDSI